MGARWAPSSTADKMTRQRVWQLNQSASEKDLRLSSKINKMSRSFMIKVLDTKILLIKDENDHLK